MAEGPDEAVCIVLMRTLRGPTQVAGSEVLTAGCGCTCWAAPSTRRALALDPTLTTACQECLGLTDPAVLMRALANGEMATVRGAMQEMREYESEHREDDQ